MSKTKNDGQARVLYTWEPPKDYIPMLSTDDYVRIQRYIRDMANYQLADKLDRGDYKGCAILQSIGLAASSEVDKWEKVLKIKENANSGITWNLFSDEDGNPVEAVYQDPKGDA